MKTAHLTIIAGMSIVLVVSSINMTFAQDDTNSSNSILPIHLSILHSPAPTLPPSENQSVVNVTLSIPELQKWSHDWQYVHTAFLGNNKSGTAGFEWQYALVYLKTPPNSGLIPCDIGWEAEVTVDVTTMKVVSASYPTMESQCHGVVITGGGPQNVQPSLSPLQQFKSGIAAKDVKCNQELQLIFKSEDGSPACVKHDTATKLITRGGWSKVIPSIENTNLNTLSENGCGQFYTAPGNQDNKKVPVLLMNSNSTGCTRLTFTIIYNYHDTPWPRIANFPPLGIVGNTNHVTHGDTFSVTPGKDFTNSFQITVMPQTVDLANYPIGSNFTVTYVIKPLPNATGFYDHSIPKLACERYPLAVGYAANQVNYSDFSYIDPLNPPCVSGPYKLTAVEISGMNHKQVELGSHP